MVRNKFFALLAVLPLFFSCNNMDEETNESATTVYGILPQFVDEDANYVTRTQIGVDASDQLSYKWGIGDVLGIYPDAGTQVAFELSASSLSADGLSCKFDGGAWALKTGHCYYAYFPFSYECFSKTVDKTNIPVSYLGQKQVAFNNTENAGQFDFNAAPASSSSSGAVSFNFVRLGALLRVKFALPATATYKKLTLKTNTNAIPIQGKVDLSASTIAYTPLQYASSLSVDLNNVSGTIGQTAYVYLMLPPMTLKTQGITMQATLDYDNKSTTYNLCTAGTTTPNTPDFKADTRYKRDAVYVSGDPEGNMSGGDDEPITYDYVDLGLSVKWATCNIGASSPEEYGDYYAWGETEEKDDYRQSTYSFYQAKTNSYQYLGINISGSIYDACCKNMKETWRMPTKEEFEELKNNCNRAIITQNNVKGLIFTSRKNGNSVFFPAAGGFYGTLKQCTNQIGDYWTATGVNASRYESAYMMTFDIGGGFNITTSTDRYLGRPIRAVCE